MLTHVTKNPDCEFIRSLDWHDSEFISGIITKGHQSEYPDTVCYDGHRRLNFDLTYDLLNGARFRFVFAGCRYLSHGLFVNMCLNKIKITGTQGVLLLNSDQDTLIDAAALLYEKFA